MTDSPAPNQSFTQADADAIYDELGTLSVALDADPLSFGPKRLNGKISEVRKALDRCERIFLDVAQNLHRIRRQRRRAETALELAKKDLLANSVEVRAGRSVADRDAIATGKLQKEVEALHRHELMEQDFEAVLVVVKAKRADLRDTAGRLRDQIRLCQEEIGLGSSWGSRVPGAAPLPPNPLGAPPDALDAMLADEGVMGDSHLSQLDDAKEGSDPNIIPGEQLVEEFGFEPHCAECGEPQHRVVGSGMACPNGHGGCDSVPPAGAEEPEEPGTEEEPPSEEPEAAPAETEGDDTLEEILPSDVPAQAAENFLDGEDLDLSTPENPKNPAVGVDDDTLEGILEEFEDLD